MALALIYGSIFELMAKVGQLCLTIRQNVRISVIPRGLAGTFLRAFYGDFVEVISGHKKILGANMKIKRMFLTACLAASAAQYAVAQDQIGEVVVTGDPFAGSYDAGTAATSSGAGAVVTTKGNAPGSYVAGIWVDPDGCQHWVMDLGIEGMMDSVLTRDGKPVCGGNATTGVAQGSCGTLQGDNLFGSGSASLSSSGASQVASLGSSLASQGRSVSVIGYTDSDGSASSNQSLSQARADAVANVLRQNGVNVASTSGRGESDPIASNNTSQGKAANRRVELVCN